MSDTPLMQQYREVKDRYPRTLVLFRVGDFFELFGADAEEGSRALGLALTSRDGGTTMAGFPHHAVDAHVRKLVQAGHSVAVCDRSRTRPQRPGAGREGRHRLSAPDRPGQRGSQ